MKTKAKITLFVFRSSAVLLCIGLTGFSLNNQFYLYQKLLGDFSAWSISGIIESLRLFTLYVVFSRKRAAVAWVGYAAIALWCLVANSWAISESITRNITRIDKRVIQIYRKVAQAAVGDIQGDIDYQRKHVRINSGLLERDPGNANVLGIQKYRKGEIARLNKEKLKIENYEPKNNSELAARISQVAIKYGVKMKYDITYSSNGDSAPKSIFGISSQNQKLIINLAIILLIEIGIFTTARYAKNNGDSLSPLYHELITPNDKSITLGDKSKKKVIYSPDTIRKHEELSGNKYFQEWIEGGARSMRHYSGAKRKFAQAANRFYKKRRELLDNKKEA